MRKRLYEIIETSEDTDKAGRVYDMVNLAAILIGLLVSILLTFDIRGKAVLSGAESLVAVFFLADYLLRVATAQYKYPDISECKAVLKYVLSVVGLIDLFSFLPFFLQGAVAFRMLRVVRILRLFRINTYYDSLNIITTVISSKRQQLLSSVFIILVLMLGASLCVYNLEHEAQPDVFENAFSGMWWAVATMLTVGYGDIYPITTAGKVFSIVITFLGVGMVAVPTGILSAGFVEQYQLVKSESAGVLLIAVYSKDGTFFANYQIEPTVSVEKYLSTHIAPLCEGGYAVVQTSNGAQNALYKL